MPPPTWPHWIRYANDVEQGKRACNRLDLLPVPLATLLSRLHHPALVQQLADLTGITDLEADPCLHGAGLHVTECGGWLQVHGDYELHPKLPHRERRLSLVLGLSHVWES